MSAYQSAVPVLQVAGVEASLRWYVDVLGLMPDPFPKTSPYSFAILRRDGAQIMLRCEFDVPSEAFMAIELERDCLADVSVTVSYHVAFRDV